MKKKLKTCTLNRLGTNGVEDLEGKDGLVYNLYNI